MQLDTVIIGLVTKNLSGNVQYVPSPEFLDAGGFKIPKATAGFMITSPLSETDSKSFYKQLY